MITYTYTVTNTGNVLLGAVTLADLQTSAAGTAVLATADDTLATDSQTQVDSANSGANGVWDTLGPDDVVTFTSSYTVLQADVDLGADLVNTVAVTATGPAGAPVLDAGASATVSLLAADPAIVAVKSAVVNDGGDGVANAGDSLTYTYVVNNAGNVTLFDIGMTETGFIGAGPLPGPVLQSGGADLDGNADAIDLGPNATATFVAVYTLLQADLDAGEMTNQATAGGNDLQGNPAADLTGATAADDDPTVTLPPSVTALGVVKSASAPVFCSPQLSG